VHFTTLFMAFGPADISVKQKKRTITLCLHSSTEPHRTFLHRNNCQAWSWDDEDNRRKLQQIRGIAKGFFQ